MMNEDLQAGDIVIGPMDGIVPGVFPVGAGQLVLFLTRRWWRMVRNVKTWWQYRHVAIVVTGHPVGRGVEICQAMPGGVEVVELSAARNNDPRYLFIRPDYEAVRVSKSGVYSITGGEVVARAALAYVGTPYNFLTYLKLAAGAFRFRLTEGWLRRKMSTRRDMMCSQHVDQSLADAGFHVFDDGRLPQDVVPAELASALLSLPGWHRFGNGPWIKNALIKS